MPVRLAGAAVRAAVEEGEQLVLGALVVGADAGVDGGEVPGVQEVGLRPEGARDEEEVLRDDGELVEDEEVGRVEGADGEGRRGVFEGVEGLGLGLGLR